MEREEEDDYYVPTWEERIEDRLHDLEDQFDRFENFATVLGEVILLVWCLSTIVLLLRS